MTLEALRSVPLFAELDDEAACELRDLLVATSVSKGQLLFRKGQSGDAMFLIQSGRIRISLHDPEGNLVILAELGQGDFFGEVALIDGRNRSADAMAVEDAVLAALSREAFVSFILHKPAVALKMLASLTERLRRMDELLSARVSRNANDEDRARATLADRAADLIASFGGSWKFILASMFLVLSWMIMNSWLLPQGFDPAPYQMLNLTLAIMAGLQAPIIMMSQNRQGEKDRLRADLDYQVNLKNELALTEVLRRLDVLESERLPQLVEQMAQYRERGGPRGRCNPP